MRDYRKLTQQEIDVLILNGCQAEDWTLVEVTRGFDPHCVRRTNFYGTAKLGGCCGSIEVS